MKKILTAFCGNYMNEERAVKNRLNTKWGEFLGWVLLFLGIFLYIHNFFVYPPTRGLDSADHIAYIKYILEKKSLPKADEGLQMYQPPLYYFLASRLFFWGENLGLKEPLKLVQLISLFSAWGIVFLVYLLGKRFFKSKEILFLVVLFSLYLPILIYEGVVISNEMFLSFLVSLGVYFFIRNNWEKESFFKVAVLGIIVGSCCLVKYSGLILAGSVLFVFFLKRRKNFVFKAGIFLLTVFLVAGWFYVRQYILFGNPLILANDPKLFPYWQYPGYRDLHFYTNLEGIMPLNVFGAEGESFWGGTYNSLWVDTHNSFLPVMEFSKAGAVIIYLGLLPTFAVVGGFFLALKKKRLDYLLLVVYSLFLFFSYFYYTFKLPFGSSIKAFYFLSTVLPLAVFFGLGARKVIEWMGRYSLFLYLELLILLIFIYKLYWYQSWWKNIGK